MQRPLLWAFSFHFLAVQTLCWPRSGRKKLQKPLSSHCGKFSRLRSAKPQQARQRAARARNKHPETAARNPALTLPDTFAIPADQSPSRPGGGQQEPATSTKKRLQENLSSRCRVLSPPRQAKAPAGPAAGSKSSKSHAKRLCKAPQRAYKAPFPPACSYRRAAKKGRAAQARSCPL